MKQLFFLVLLMIIVGVDACRCFGGKRSSKKSTTVTGAVVDEAKVFPAADEPKVDTAAAATDIKEPTPVSGKKSEEKSK
jgi:hypothetical protein